MSSTAARTRVAVLISGRGSNMSALLAASAQPDYPAEIIGVISNRADAAGLDVAKAAGIATAVIPHRDFVSRAAFDSALDRQLRAWNPELVALAGFMRLLTFEFTESWRGRMINIHPALLPEFKGLDTHRRAIEGGAKIHGCTVHFVTPGMDEGPIIAQAEVPVLPDDTPESLGARVLREEHRIYPQALARVARGEFTLP